MKVKVDQDKCIGCGACVAIAPNNFEFNDDGLSSVVNDEITEATIDASEACPVYAIEVEKCNCGDDCKCKENGECTCSDDCKCKENGECTCGDDCKCKENGECTCGDDCKCKEDGECNCGDDCKCHNEEA